jgi:hypothetical protein
MGCLPTLGVRLHIVRGDSNADEHDDAADENPTNFIRLLFLFLLLNHALVGVLAAPSSATKAAVGLLDPIRPLLEPWRWPGGTGGRRRQAPRRRHSRRI